MHRKPPCSALCHHPSYPASHQLMATASRASCAVHGVGSTLGRGREMAHGCVDHGGCQNPSGCIDQGLLIRSGCIGPRRAPLR